MNEMQIEKLLNACYQEFCYTVGDTPCGCEVCPYNIYNTDESEDGCEEEYFKDKLNSLKS